ISFLIPPRVPEIRIHEKITLMHVTVHALRRRDRARELVHDRVAALILGNSRVLGKAQSLVPVLAPPARISQRTIVSVNDMARRTTTRAVISRMIVRAQETQQRIVQPRFGRAEEYRVRAV